MFADWLNAKAANTGDITAEVLIWGVVAQVLTVSIATILLVLLEGPYPLFWGAHFRHSVFVDIFGFLFLLGASVGGHISHSLEYAAAQAAAAVVANASVLWFARLRSRRVAA